MSKLYDEVERPLVRVLAQMEDAGVRVDVDRLRAPGRASWPPRPGGWSRRSRTWPATQFVVNSTPQLREILFDKLGPHPAEADQDRVLDRRPDAGEAARRAPDHRGPAALPGGREAALDLRGVAAGRGGAGRAHPRHVQPDRGPHRPAQLRPAQPAQHPGPQRGGPAVPVVLPAGGGMPLPGRRLQPDRAAGHRPPGRGPRADRGVPDRDRHPQRDRVADLRRRAAAT